MFRYNKDITYTVETIDVEKEEVQFIGQKESKFVVTKQVDKICIYKNGKQIDSFILTIESDMYPVMSTIDSIERNVKQRLMELGI
ncbi:hypothetical protein ACP49_09305 [Clostridium botulinum]|uniref:hypothetical protein n=1 Tax=Clostridium botulinum TaxID=1491 RepID=UPI0005F8DD11|nr:hypothetical protein [Clostridium botulinum]KOM97256.1 hypothetical protein ACP53_04195 [Clostridium botulinum]KON00759.1 hypothetical protein ACP49_09305 [Clostridium botulinum]MBY7003544.1 hypothetical protein [Clostridium botulinum]MCR1145982.1 hypothetical protein [Clostridium botulinum]NFH93146.1 hypothetical protein [Clostridium botulinum]